MKKWVLGIFIVAILTALAMTGCQAARKVEPTTAKGSEKHTNPALTLEEAQNIALKHAGFAADQVTALHTEYEVDHGIPQYDVEFRHGYWEYDYEIHADTGEILSYSKDD